MVMRIVTGQRPNGQQQRSWQIMDALSSALDGESHVRNYAVRDVDDVDLYLQWGYRLTPALDSVVKARKPFVVVDGGFFHDRDQHFGLNINGFQKYGQPAFIKTTGARTERPRVEPWREAGDLIIVYGQVPTDRSLRGLDHDKWVEQTCDALEDYYPNHTVGVRPHPKSVKPALKLPPMDAAYDRLHLAVTYTSTAGVQTCMAGIPTLVGHPAAIAAPVASHTLSRLRWPGRENWADRLTWFQYADGEAEAAAEFLMSNFSHIQRQAELGLYDLEGIRP